MDLERGDVVRSSDPFKLGTDRQRPWLLVSNDTHPFEGEQYIAVAVSTKEYPDSIPLPDEDWVTGGVPERSFASPWAVHSPRREDFVAWQGRVDDSIVTAVVDSLTGFVAGNERCG